MMRRAEARFSASMMISSSIRWSLAGAEVDWMTNTSSPRTFSCTSTKISIVGEAAHDASGQRGLEVGRDRLGEGAVAVACNQFHRSLLRHRA